MNFISFIVLNLVTSLSFYSTFVHYFEIIILTPTSLRVELKILKEENFCTLLDTNFFKNRAINIKRENSRTLLFINGYSFMYIIWEKI